MKINDIPFGITDWSKITPTRKSGISGFALWQTQVFGDIRVRIVEYSPTMRQIIGVKKVIYYIAWRAHLTLSLVMAELLI